MQKEIGSVMGLYPTPVTIVGVVSGEQVNFLPIAHVGVVEHNTFLISMDKTHKLSDAAIQETKVVSVSLVNEDMLIAADYCGIVKGESIDKSQVFRYHFDELKKAPVLDDAPVCMTCQVIDVVDVGNFANYILKPIHTYVQEECLNPNGKIDYEKVRPVLFEFQNAQYLSIGSVIGKCWNIGSEYNRK